MDTQRGVVSLNFRGLNGDDRIRVVHANRRGSAYLQRLVTRVERWNRQVRAYLGQIFQWSSQPRVKLRLTFQSFRQVGQVKSKKQIEWQSGGIDRRLCVVPAFEIYLAMSIYGSVEHPGI